VTQGQAGFPTRAKQITGPGASAIKYDILTALLVTAARGEPAEARLALRLSLLITARFNWRSGCFAVGLKEMARMWGVTERTAKREMAQMRGLGWIVVSVPAARGRVAQYRIELPVILHATMTHWDAVGPDFVARMSNAPEPDAHAETNVVPLRREVTPPEDDGSEWARAARRLQAQDPAIYGSWFAPLQPADFESGTLTLVAPSRFIASYVRTHFLTRLLAALTAENRSIRDVQIVTAER
jgi:hypothetical protein